MLKRTTLLLVRYRFQLVLPGRYGDKPLIAEDARVLGFAGSPANPEWLADETAQALLNATADANTAPEFARAAVSRILDGLPEVLPEVNRRGYGTRRGTPGGAPPGAPQHRPGRPRGPGNAAGRRRHSRHYVYLPFTADHGTGH